MSRDTLWWRRKHTLAALCGAALFSLGCAIGGDFVGYEDLPAEPSRYTLEVMTGDVTTRWEYTSARPEEAGNPESRPCLDGPDPGECRPEPLIFLKYDLGLSLDNTVAAGPPHRIVVTGYYQERLDSPPQVTDIQVEVSFDEGATWQKLTSVPAGENSVAVTIHHQPKATSVGLRVTAVDSDGNTVVQTIPEAYRLR